MQPRDLDRVRFVTRHFGDLQGLQRVVPLGVLFLAIGLGKTSSGAFMSVFAPVLAASSFGLMFVARLYYRRIFGEVERQRRFHPLGTILSFAGLLIGLYLIRSLGEVRCNYILFGSLLLGTWSLLEWRLPHAHYLVFGALLLGIAARAPSFAFFLPALMKRGMNEILFGAAMILAGLLDHRQLVHTLGASVTASHEAEVAEPR